MSKQRKFNDKPMAKKFIVDKNEFIYGLRMLQKNHVISQSLGTNLGGENSNEILESLSISVEGIEQRDFSLKKISKDKEFIKNPKILEKKDYKELENEYDRPDDKFPNEQDPFYQLDDYRENNNSFLVKKEEFIQSNKTNLIVKNLLKQNIKKPNLKQLKALK